jgi:hypothetical protein
MPFDQRELRYFVGLDLGQSQDYSAISILQQDYDAFQKQYLYQLRYLERVPLGTKYSSSDANEDSVTRRVKKILLSETLNGNTQMGIDPPIEPVALVLDHTGVGSPISELFELPRLLTGPGPQYRLVKINITGGLNSSRAKGGYNVPKRDIVFSLLRIFQSGRLKISGKLALAHTFQDELLNFKVKISDNGKDTYGALREGVHDDLVLSVAIACWFAEHKYGKRA